MKYQLQSRNPRGSCYGKDYASSNVVVQGTRGAVPDIGIWVLCHYPMINNPLPLQYLLIMSVARLRYSTSDKTLSNLNRQM